jgi:hypothetical protein
MAVLAHMNQPLGFCMAYIAKLAASQPPSNRVESQVTSGTEEMEFTWSDARDLFLQETGTTDDCSMAVDDHLPVNQCRPALNVKEFKGAGHMFGMGRTFLDDFNADPYGPEREVNLYYPFASKAEWELASFLLLSGVSMANITSFLSLKLVCTFAATSTRINHRTFRWSRSVFLSVLQKTCGCGWKCSQEVHSGSSKLGKQPSQLSSH